MSGIHTRDGHVTKRLAPKRARPGMTRRYGVDVWLVPGVSLATGAMIWIAS